LQGQAIGKTQARAAREVGDGEGSAFMPVISWNHLQYARERRLFTEIRPRLDSILKQYSDFSRLTQQHQTHFFDLLSHSFKVNNHPIFAGLTETVIKRLQLQTKPVVFLFQSPSASAMCMPKSMNGQEEGTLSGPAPRELIVLVSQHYLNHLKEPEQLSILGHELGHMLFRHVDIPSGAILEADLPMSEFGDLKSNVRKWMICAEISCDMIGLCACGFDPDAFCSAMFKFCTGVHPGIIDHYARTHSFVDLAMLQFEEISDSHLAPSLSTHPLPPLRMKIVRTVAQLPLCKAFGADQPEPKLREMVDEFNKAIDGLVNQIYPEIAPDMGMRGNEAALSLCLAVALADGDIADAEVQAVVKITNETQDAFEIVRTLKNKIKTTGAEALTRELIARAIRSTTRQQLPRRAVVSIVRQAVMVAAADNNVAKVELETVYEYARDFDLTREDIVAILSQIKQGS
jgi:uncharacterized tellurite resistance protein B-like protein